MADIVERIRARFPRPQHADDGLFANEAADKIEHLRGELRELALRGAEDLHKLQRAEPVIKAARTMLDPLSKQTDKVARVAHALDAYDKSTA